MKKTIFSALIVVAAVGGTLVSNAKSARFLTPSGPLSFTQPCNQIDVNCTPTPGIQCKVAGINQYTTNPLTGKCSRPLFFNQ